MTFQVSPESAMASAIASVEIEGFRVSAEERALLQRIVMGELTATEAMHQIVEEYQRRVI